MTNYLSIDSYPRLRLPLESIDSNPYTIFIEMSRPTNYIKEDVVWIKYLFLAIKIRIQTRFVPLSLMPIEKANSD
jgi:hypothetical protein